MSTDRDVTRIVRSWLEEGVTTLPDRVLDDVLDRVPATPQRRSWWPARRFAQMNNLARLAIAAAAVVVVAVAGYNLLPGSGGPGGPTASASPSPSAPSSSVPTSGPSPTPAWTFPADFSDHEGNGTLLPAGEWVITHLEPMRITITIPDGWFKGSIDWAVFPNPQNSPSVAFLEVQNLYDDQCSLDRQPREPAVGPTVEDLVAALGDVPAMTATEPVDVTVDGYNGQRIALSMPAEASCPTTEPVLWVSTRNRDAPGVGPGSSLDLWILDVDGTRLVVAIVDRADDDVRLAEAQEIVDSIRIEP